MKTKQLQPTKKLELYEKLLLYGPFGIAGIFFLVCLVIEVTGMELSKELRGEIYIKSGNFTFALSILLSILYGQKYGLSWLRSIIYSLASFLLVFSAASQLWRDLDLKVFDSASVASFRSILLLPVLCWILSRFDGRSTLTLCDYLTPYYFFQHGITTHACWIAGCCEGRTMAWGIINPNTGLPAFPAQPYAIVLALSISLWGLLNARKKDYKTHGEIFSGSLIVYGFFRYVMEFFTDDLLVTGYLSLYSYYSLLLILMGFGVRWYLRRRPVRSMEIDSSKPFVKNVEE